MKFSAILFSLLFSTLFLFVQIEGTLLLSQVIIRHGNKTMDLEYTFPNDNHENISFGPYGPGELNLVQLILKNHHIFRTFFVCSRRVKRKCFKLVKP